jgi:hypothetical protein
MIMSVSRSVDLVITLAKNRNSFSQLPQYFTVGDILHEFLDRQNFNSPVFQADAAEINPKTCLKPLFMK